MIWFYFWCQKTIMLSKTVIKLILTLVVDEVCIAAGKSPESKQTLSNVEISFLEETFHYWNIWLILWIIVIGHKSHRLTSFAKFLSNICLLCKLLKAVIMPQYKLFSNTNRQEHIVWLKLIWRLKVCKCNFLHHQALHFW